MTPYGVDLRLLNTFVIVADCPSFTVAAHRLHLSQQAVSQHIARLETMLGATLFARGPKSAQLTAVGRRILPGARQLLSQAREFTAIAGHRPLIIAGVKDYGPSATLAAAVQKDQPHAHVEIADLSSVVQLEQLERHLIDAAVLRLDRPRPDLTVSTIRLEPVMVAVGPNHPLAGAPRLQLSSLTAVVAGTSPEWQSRLSWISDLRRAVNARWTLTDQCGPSVTTAVQVAASCRLTALVPISNVAVYRSAGCRVEPPAEVTPLYAWSLATLPDRTDLAFLHRLARSLTTEKGWLTELDTYDNPWLPPNDPAQAALHRHTN